MPYVNKAGHLCGFLDYEEKSNSNHFVRRFFLLDKPNGRWEYFMDNPQNLPMGTAPLGVFNVRYLSLVGSNARPKMPTCFYAIFTGTKHYFRADDLTERDKWISVLTDAAKVTVNTTSASVMTAASSTEPYRADIYGGVVHKIKLTADNDTNSSDDNVSGDGRIPPLHSLQTIYCGYCVKQGGRRKNWLKRYFTLTPDGLSYYKTANNSALLNHIPKADIVEARISVGVFTNKEYLFEVVTPYRVFYMQAESEVHRDAWINHINALVNSSKRLPAFAVEPPDVIPVAAMTLSQASHVSPATPIVSHVTAFSNTTATTNTPSSGLTKQKPSQSSPALTPSSSSTSLASAGKSRIADYFPATALTPKPKVTVKAVSSAALASSGDLPFGTYSNATYDPSRIIYNDAPQTSSSHNASSHSSAAIQTNKNSVLYSSKKPALVSLSANPAISDNSSDKTRISKPHGDLPGGLEHKSSIASIVKPATVNCTSSVSKFDEDDVFVSDTGLSVVATATPIGHARASRSSVQSLAVPQPSAFTDSRLSPDATRDLRQLLAQLDEEPQPVAVPAVRITRGNNSSPNDVVSSLKKQLDSSNNGSSSSINSGSSVERTAPKKPQLYSEVVAAPQQRPLNLSADKSLSRHESLRNKDSAVGPFHVQAAVPLSSPTSLPATGVANTFATFPRNQTAPRVKSSTGADGSREGYVQASVRRNASARYANEKRFIRPMSATVAHVHHEQRSSSLSSSLPTGSKPRSHTQASSTQFSRNSYTTQQGQSMAALDLSNSKVSSTAASKSTSLSSSEVTIPSRNAYV